jgi:hypothetical protein
VGYAENLPRRAGGPEGSGINEGEAAMNTHTQPTPPDSREPRRRLAPALALIFLAPMIAEVLSGATRVSVIFVLIPEMMVWGCGALIIREAVRRWHAGWTSMLLLGLALSVAEEFIVQQTSLAPLPWLGSAPIYGRLWGVNWIYFLFMLGYESVWVVLVPVHVTELIFPQRREEPWLGNVGLVISGLVFLLGSYIAWYAWVKRARPVVFHAPEYHPPATTILAGLLAIVLLALAAFAARGLGQAAPKATRATPPAWGVGLAGLVLSCPWYLLMGLVFSAPRPAFSFWIPMAAGWVWALLAYALIRRWSSSPQWQDMHRWVLAFAATLVCMVGGFLGSSTWPRVDLIGKAVLNVLAVLGFLLLLRRIRQRARAMNKRFA